MQVLYDFFPIAIFFIVYKIFGIYAATFAAIIVTFLQMLIHWVRHKNFDVLQAITFSIIAILGGTTIALHQAIFIKWKPTVINWLFALVFLITQLFCKKPLLRYLMEKKIQLPDKAWKTLNLSWILFFVILGTINLYVVYHFSTNAWVNFKLFGYLGLTVVFAILQAIYLSRYINDGEMSDSQ